MGNTGSPPAADRFFGCLLGGALGDALGAPVEGLPLRAVQRAFGARGPGGGTLRITSATQLAMFTAHGLVQASVRARAKGIGGAEIGLIRSGYLAWARRQDEAIAEQFLEGGGWLLGEEVLTDRRDASGTCLSALRRAAGHGSPGTVEDPVNDSKGSAAVVRSAPCGFAWWDADLAFKTGCAAAALTHGHPGGYLPAGVLAATVAETLRGAELADALARARGLLEAHPAHGETSTALDAAVALAARHPAPPERIEELGAGWTGVEALAIGVYAALAVSATTRAEHPGAIGRAGLILAATHSGDSDATASICGSLLGARHGGDAFPGHWQAGLDARRAVIQLAADCALEFRHDQPSDAHGMPTRSWTDHLNGGPPRP